jgi:hypothetical protein
VSSSVVDSDKARFLTTQNEIKPDSYRKSVTCSGNASRIGLTQTMVPEIKDMFVRLTGDSCLPVRSHLILLCILQYTVA